MREEIRARIRVVPDSILGRPSFWQEPVLRIELTHPADEHQARSGLSLGREYSVHSGRARCIASVNGSVLLFDNVRPSRLACEPRMCSDPGSKPVQPLSPIRTLPQLGYDVIIFILMEC